MKLTNKQELAVYYLRDNQISEVVYGGGAGGGKSALGCLWLMEQCQKYPGTRWLMGRSKLKTLKETTLNTFFQLSSLLEISNQYEYNAQTGVISWNNGSSIILKDLFRYPSDPEFDSLGSLEITGAFIDEISQIVYKAWEIVKSRIRYKLKEHNLSPKILGTCNPSKGWVYRLFYKPFKSNDMPITRAFVQSLAYDNPHLPDSYLKTLSGLDEQTKQRLLHGNWDYDDDPAVMVAFEDIMALWTNTFVPGGEKYIVADIARFGSDKAVIMVWNGWQVIECIIYDVSKTTQIQTTISALRQKHQVRLSNVIVDEDGIGGGVVDSLGCTGFVNGSRPNNPNYTNLKSECGYKLSEQISSIWINCDLEQKNIDYIQQELGQLKTYDADKDGKLKILPKEKIKESIGRSPDFLDCFIMRMLPEVSQTVENWTL